MIHSADPRTRLPTGLLSWRRCGKELGAVDLHAELDATGHGAELGVKICGAELLAYTRRAAGRATPVSPVLSVFCSGRRRATPAATSPPARSTCGDPPPRARSGRPRASARRASCSRGLPPAPPSLRRSRPARRTVLLSLRALSRSRAARPPLAGRAPGRRSPPRLHRFKAVAFRAASERVRARLRFERRTPRHGESLPTPQASRGARRRRLLAGNAPPAPRPRLVSGDWRVPSSTNAMLARNHRAIVEAFHRTPCLHRRYLKRVDEVVPEARDICAPGLSSQCKKESINADDSLVVSNYLQ
jgi:hypothetical protein